MTPKGFADAPKPSLNAPETPAKWVPVSEAAAALSVSARAIQKRAARGTLAARKIERGGATVWEIDGRELDANARRDGREPANPAGEVDAPATAFDAQNGRELPANMDANARTDGRERGREMDADREADYRAEVAFLRGLIEQRDRDAAELRAALRKALEAQPRALPQAQEHAKTSENSGAAPTQAKAPKDGQAGREMTYADVLAELESSL